MKFYKKKIFKTIWKIARPLFVVVAFFLILRNVKFEGLRDAFFVVQWWTVFASLFCLVNALFFQGIRWWVLIRAFSDNVPFLKAMSIHLSSTFYSLVLPNSTIQEVIRTVYVTKSAGYVVGWSSAWISKIMGIVVSFSISAFGLLISADITIPVIVYKVVLGLFILMCIAFLLSFTKKASRPIRNLLTRLFPNFSLTWLENLREGIYRFRDQKKMLLLSFLITIATQLFMLWGVSFLLLGITGKEYFIEVMTFIPLIEMISMAQPFTPGGVGVREALVAVMFRHLNLTSEQLAVYVLLSNMAILVKLIGAVPVLYDVIQKRRLKKESQK